MKNHHIQKQIIEEFREKFPDSGMTGSEAWATLQRHVEAFLKTSLERVWEEAEKEMLNKLIKHYEHNGWLTNELNDIRTGKKALKLKQTT